MFLMWASGCNNSRLCNLLRVRDCASIYKAIREFEESIFYGLEVDLTHC